MSSTGRGENMTDTRGGGFGFCSLSHRFVLDYICAHVHVCVTTSPQLVLSDFAVHLSMHSATHTARLDPSHPRAILIPSSLLQSQSRAVSFGAVCCQLLVCVSV